MRRADFLKVLPLAALAPFIPKREPEPDALVTGDTYWTRPVVSKVGDMMIDVDGTVYVLHHTRHPEWTTYEWVPVSV